MYLFYGDGMIAFFLTAVVSAIFLILKYAARNDDYWIKRGVISQPRMSLWQFYKIIKTKPLHELFLDDFKKYGKVYGGFQFSTPLVIVGDANLLRGILVKDVSSFAHKLQIKCGDKIMDNMLILLKGEDWKRVRTVITPAFTSRRMRMMESIIIDCAKTVVQSFDKQFQKNEPVDCKSLYGAFTMDVIASAAFATKIDSHNDPENIFVKKAKESFVEFSPMSFLIYMILPLKLITTLGLGSDFMSMKFFRKVILEVIKERKQSGKRYSDILQILMDALDENRSELIEKEHSELLQDDLDRYGTIVDNKMATSKFKKISEDELLAQCVLFFMVGYETTASALSFLSYSLALNPHWQERLVQEVDEAFAKNKEMSYDTVRDMKVLDAVIQETLRMFPSLLGFDRLCSEDYQLGDTGITVKKGMSVSVPIYSIHYNPEYYPDPHTFNPERFMTDSPVHPQYAYLPFGAGPRNCLGMRFALLEIKLCITNILRRYTFRKASETKVPLDFKKNFVFLSVDKLPLSIDKRTEVKI